MADEIVNRVANSALETIDLEAVYPKGPRVSLDIAPWLYEGLILREKEFRSQVTAHDWGQYKDCFVAIHCSADAIIPGWAFLLVSLQLAGLASKTVIGSLVDLETVLYAEIINGMDLSAYDNKSVIIKGCANKPVPENAYVLLAQRLQPISKSIMYGEACSAVPLFKKRR